jgi:RNase P subunit RPR2
MYQKCRKYFISKKSRDLDEQRRIAQERVDILSELIRKNPQNPFNRRYLDLIKKIKKLYRVK